LFSQNRSLRRIGEKWSYRTVNREYLHCFGKIGAIDEIDLIIEFASHPEICAHDDGYLVCFVWDLLFSVFSNESLNMKYRNVCQNLIEIYVTESASALDSFDKLMPFLLERPDANPSFYFEILRDVHARICHELTGKLLPDLICIMNDR
jgi:hypothetical protein